MVTKTVLITGANRGLGLEFVKQFAAKGYKVIATRRAGKATELRAIKGNISIQDLNITAENQIRDLKDILSKVPIDILILNAGVVGQRDIKIGNIDIDNLIDTFKINAIYPLKLIESLYQNLLNGNDKKVVVITTRMDSIFDNHLGGYYSYRGSKAALNSIMKSVAVDQQENDLKVLLLYPGWVRTDIGGSNAHSDAEESVFGMINVIESDFKTGEFLNYKGERVPW